MSDSARRNAFEADAELYDRVRPEYPDELIDDLLALSHAKRESRILEIGAGTGKATEPLIQRGFSVLCIEPSSRMAAVLRHKLPGVALVNERFEEWQIGAESRFDLIYSAQAFHWVSPDVRYVKTRSLLEREGSLGLFWYEPIRVPSNLGLAIDQAVAKVAPEFCKESSPGMGDRLAEISSNGLYTDIVVRQYETCTLISAEAYAGGVRSASWLLALDERRSHELEARIEEAIGRYPNDVESKMRFRLYFAKPH